ncbi:hypothetical protein ACJ41O_006617 [Fusarium nematophilum]
MPNGCGDQNDGVDFPDLDFESDCWKHDQCWGNCNRGFDECNGEFYDNMMATCEKYGIPTLNLLCKGAAAIYFGAVDSFIGANKFAAATEKHCNVLLAAA